MMSLVATCRTNRQRVVVAAPDVLEWIRKMRAGGIQAIISLMGPQELGHYATACSKLGAADLHDLYKSRGPDC